MYYRKRYTRGRRRRYGQAMKTNSGDSAASNQLAVYRSPFSTATTNPKIPDGKAYHSSGIRLQAVKEWVNNTATTMDFLVFPGLNNGLIMANASPANGRYMSYPSHGQFTLAGAVASQVNEGLIDKWRIVSQALRITLINNSDENDGWWEAVRVQVGISSNFLLDDTAQGVIVGTSSPATSLPGVDITRQMVENPTYVSGKLRDIHRHLFQLAPQGSDHDFIEMSPSHPNEGFGASDTIIDKNYDAIYIRIHGRTGLTSPTRIMTHMVSNQEVVYDEGSTLCRYHSETSMTPKFSAAKRRVITSSTRASKRSKKSLF